MPEEAHWYMQLQAIGFAIFPSDEIIEGRKKLRNYDGYQVVRVQVRFRDGRNGNLWYLGKVDRVAANDLAYNIWSYIVPPLSDKDEEQLAIVAGTD